jgi:penicillin G amidase
MRSIALSLAGLFFLCAAPGCGDDDKGIVDTGPYDGVPASQTIQAAGLSAPVDVVRDRYGVGHIYARSVSDLAFANGYVQAQERLQQMDLFRRFAAGTLSELFGALDPGQIDADLEMRMHRMRPLAEEAWQTLMSSSDPGDQEIVLYLTRFSDGVNHYVADLQAGRWQLDPAQTFFFDPGRMPAWTPVDSLAIGRLQAFALSFDAGGEVRITEWIDSARTTFDQADPQAEPDLARRAGMAWDLFPLAPMDPTSTIDGFPNVAGDGGTRARQTTTRPRLSGETLKAADRTISAKTELARRLRDAFNGSNNWVVGPELAGGNTILANDPHLTLSSPSIFHLIHLTVPGDIDVAGISFPGIPGVILGHNSEVAWGSTTVIHDVTDFYAEQVVPCAQGGGDCVIWKDQEVAIQTWQETVQIGALGTITETRTVTYEYVPHHGPILPTIVDHDVVPRQGDAISVRYTGHEISSEISSLQKLWRARDRAEAFAAFDDYGFGAQNWVFIDNAGSIGWTSMARVPRRTPGCFGFHPTESPDGVAPFLLMPGDGTCEWDGWMDARYIPHAVDPEAGFLVTANADPVGATFDGDPLNGPVVDGSPLYAGAFYAEGMRAGRITRRLQARIYAGAALTSQDMMEIQADTFSNYGERMRPHILAATAALAAEMAQPGTHPDLQAWALALTQDQRQALMSAAGYLDSWTLETPAAVTGTLLPADIADSVATSIFNIWVVEFLRQALGDELARAGQSPSTLHARGLLRILEQPENLHSGLAPETGQPILCDDLDTPGEIESCTLIILKALDSAIAWAGGAQGFATADMNEWRWGQLHTLTLLPMLPISELRIPPSDDPDPALRKGYPRPGDGYSVDASHPGYDNFDFSYTHGPAMRHVTELSPGGRPITYMALPGGQSSHRDSGHFRDLMDAYWVRNEYFPMPWTTEEIIGDAETRWRFDSAGE